MQQIIAIVKPFVAENVLGALLKNGFSDITVREVHGYGRQKSYLSEYQSNEFSRTFLPKIEICVWAESDAADQVAEIISQQARTGRMGDGKIFSINAQPRNLEQDGTANN